MSNDKMREAALIEAVTKAILFQDSGSTEDWEANTDLGEAAIAAYRAAQPATVPEGDRQYASAVVTAFGPEQGIHFEGESWARLHKAISALLAAAPKPEQQEAPAERECRHCGFLCRPNPAESRKWYPLERVCEWSKDDDPAMPDTWDGTCGVKWSFIDGDPLGNGLRFCPYCGARAVIAADRARRNPK